MRILFSAHAVSRCAERDIDPRYVVRRLQPYAHLHCRMSLLCDGRISVIAAPRGENLEVVTVIDRGEQPRRKRARLKL